MNALMKSKKNSRTKRKLNHRWGLNVKPQTMCDLFRIGKVLKCLQYLTNVCVENVLI